MTATRRDVLYTIGMAAATTALCGCTGDSGDDPGVPAGVAEMCGANVCMKLSANPELQMVGGMVFISIANKKLFVQRTSETELIALSAVCTHAACPVSFNGVDKFTCPCHGSAFAIADGSVINGPAQRPLDDFAVALTGDDVTITI